MTIPFIKLLVGLGLICSMCISSHYEIPSCIKLAHICLGEQSDWSCMTVSFTTNFDEGGKVLLLVESEL